MVSVLFLCTHNAMRSIVAESILRATGRGRFLAHSAAVEPVSVLNEEVLDFLRTRHLPVEGLRSKSWREFAGPDSAHLSFVIALDARAAAIAEEYPWPGEPVVAHWPIDDDEDERASWAIRDAFWILSRRIKIFADLPHGKSTRHALQRRLNALEAWH